jgi:hypothetical protein
MAKSKRKLFVCPWCKFVTSGVNSTYTYGDDDYTEYVICPRCEKQIGYTNFYYDADRKGAEDNGVFCYNRPDG